MPNLTYYQTEQEQFKEAYALKLDDSQTIIVVTKLCHHFMKKRASICGRALRNPRVRFYGTRQTGCARFGTWKGPEIRLSHNPSLGLICHEVAHFVNRYNQKPGKKENYHTKRLLRTVGKLISYAMKKGLWIYIEPFSFIK